VLPLRGKTKPAPRQPFAQPAIAFDVRRSVHFTRNLTPPPRLSIVGTILIPAPPRAQVNAWSQCPLVYSNKGGKSRAPWRTRTISMPAPIGR
jgi:hypothetical protein